MGDCGRIANCATASTQDMADACDIVRRFEQLETQWMSFQRRSPKLEGDEDNSQKSTTSPPRNHLQKCAVTSAASSYSNPLFTNHSTAKPAQNIGDKTSSSSSRTSNLYAGSEIKTDRAPFSFFRQKNPGVLATSPRDATTAKDDHSSYLGSPSTSVVGSSCPNSEKAFKDGQVSPSSDTKVTRDTMATFFRNKPPLGCAVQTISKAPNIGNEKYVSCASSITRHTFRKRADHTRELQSSFKQQEIVGLECPQQSTSMTRSSNGDDFRESDAEMIESLHSITYPSTSDPGTCSPGNGSSGSHLSSSGLEQSTDAHINQSRSPPSASETSATVGTSQLNPLLGHDRVSDRNISWRVLGERGVLSEGTFRMDRHSSEHHDAQCKSEEEKGLSNDKLIQNVTGVSSKDCNLLKSEAQVDQKNVSEAEHEKPSDRLDKVNWELRLSKREAALRIAEEKILEEEQKISQARLAVSRCEDSLRHREQDMQRESKKQKIDLGESLKSIETGKTVMKKLYTGLKDVLWQLEQKEKVLQNTWLEVKDSVCTETGFGDHSFGFEPELSLKDKRSGTLDGISFLTAEGKCEEWCSTVVGICERLVTFMNRETHLQKWATVLEREGIRMGKMTKEMAKAKEAANEQCARSEDMMKCAEEQAARMDEERVKLARERDNLILWVTHLQERRKIPTESSDSRLTATLVEQLGFPHRWLCPLIGVSREVTRTRRLFPAVAECEREAAKSLADVQKKAADLFVHESNLDERALEISALQEELRVTSQRLQDDQELINQEKHKVQEKIRLVVGREREVESKISVMKKLQEDLDTKAEQVEKDRVDEKRKEKLLLTFQETEKRINAKEMSVRELEKELEHKAAAVEEMTNNVNDREKSLVELQLHMEQERSRIQEVMTGLEKEKVRLKEAEEAAVVAHCSKKSAEEAWARTVQERRESSEYLRSVEDHLKRWEVKLLCKEKELQGQQKKLQEIENQAKEEQEQSEALHAKLVQEQESWTQELKVKQESLTKRNRALDAKEEEINNDLDRLTEERRVALEDIKRLAEMEARAWGAERDLQTKHDEHLKEVRKHADDYKTQVEDLALAKREVQREFEELRAKKQELKIWQREAEETLQNRIDSFVKGKEELTAQIKELKKLQTDIEQAGSQIIDRVAELDQASSRLERQRHKVETSKKKLEALADKLATHQEVLKRRECEFLTQESKLVAVQNGLKKMAAEAATKEKNLRSREQAVIDSENDLHDVEARLANERKDLKKMLAEVEQHAAKLKEETTSVEELSRSHTRDELLIKERREQLQSKERELAEFETDLKKKAKSLEEHGQTISKLEMQVKERLQRAVEFETKSEELEKGWKQFAIKREALNRTETEIQRRAENDEVQRQLHSEIDEEKRQAEVAHRMSKSNKREARPDFKELKTGDVLVLNKMDEGMEDRLKQMEEAFQKEAVKISQERANLKLQQQDLEETRKAVVEVKLTLEAQLKATKEIVAGASLTAQNASREREALEEERKRLAQDRTDAEAAAAAKEEKLAMEAKHLETVKSILDQEKEKAMEMIQQAAKKAMRAERAKAESSSAQRDSMMLHKEIQCEASLKNRENELYATAENTRREKMNLNEEKPRVKFLDDALEREQMEHPHVYLKNPTKVNALLKNAENQMTWGEMRKDRCIRDANGWEPTSGGSPNDTTSLVTEREFSFSTMRSASEINGAIGDFGEGSGRHAHAYREPAHHIIPKTEWVEAFDSATPSIHATYDQTAPEKMTANCSSPIFVEKNGSPSQKRLENVMTSLMQARQASRSRLQRTKNALLAFPPSSGFIIQVEQALNALSARLSLMEQIEEGLESHLRNAYETELPESERVLGDKVQLLCRMEEQQSLRVEWEEDMQRQLETISMLQAASRSSPSFSTPPRDPNHGALPMNDWQNHDGNVYEDGKGHGCYEMSRSGGNAEVNLSADLYNGGVSRPSTQFSNFNRSKVFEPSDDLDSPLVAHGYLSNPADQHCHELGAHELQYHQRSTRRKLLLSSPQVTYA